MPLSSMTGFARAHGSHGVWRWHWEVRSVNARGLDLRVRLPEGFESLEQPTRILASERFTRGGVTATLTVDSEANRGAIRINEDALNQVLTALRTLEGSVRAELPRLDGILALRGVIEVQPNEVGQVELASRDAALLSSLTQALDGLATARREEGSRLNNFLGNQTSKLAELVEQAARLASSQPEMLQGKLKNALALLAANTSGFSPDRIAQEVALLLVRADVREEIDRLKSHLTQANDLLASKGAQGRRLDFLSQELNREANTLCSKSSDIQLTRVGLELKTIIDQFREQVQNVE
ncbi:MAG: YicC/YloC family endoribonuclease [Micropepsaceae bacterium]